MAEADEHKTGNAGPHTSDELCEGEVQAASDAAQEALEALLRTIAQTACAPSTQMVDAACAAGEAARDVKMSELEKAGWNASVLTMAKAATNAALSAAASAISAGLCIEAVEAAGMAAYDCAIRYHGIDIPSWRIEEESKTAGKAVQAMLLRLLPGRHAEGACVPRSGYWDAHRGLDGAHTALPQEQERSSEHNFVQLHQTELTQGIQFGNRYIGGVEEGY